MGPRTGTTLPRGEQKSSRIFGVLIQQSVRSFLFTASLPTLLSIAERASSGAALDHYYYRCSLPLHVSNRPGHSSTKNTLSQSTRWGDWVRTTNQ